MVRCETKRTVCEKDNCAGCMLCQDICNYNAIQIKDELNAYNAYIDEQKCVNCGACHKLCPQNNYDNFQEPILWKEGWCLDKEERAKSSSGGIATAVAKGFSKTGGVVCSCAYKDGLFSFHFAYTPEECNQFRGSKYVKSSPDRVYKEIKRLVTRDQRKVLFIGLPCQVSAVKQFVGEKFYESLYTIDLICHGTPSPKILESYLKSEGFSGISEFNNLEFRKKNRFYLRQYEDKIIRKPFQDRYTSCFLKCVDYTENCYKCKYARFQRIADLTLGDSWGSNLKQTEISQGVSLVLCQTEKGKCLLAGANLYLKDVDIQKAVAANQQLVHPSYKPAERDRLLRILSQGGSFSYAFAKSYPLQFGKQCLKVAVYKLMDKITG